MKRNLIYSSLVFALVFSWLLVGVITQLSMGTDGDNDLGIGVLIFFCFATASIAAAFFFVIFERFGKRFFRDSEAEYSPSKKFATVASLLMMVSIISGFADSYSIGKERQKEAYAKAKMKDDEARNLAYRQEKERQRLAALSPAERAAEERAARKEVAARAALEAKEKAEKEALAARQAAANSRTQKLIAQFGPAPVQSEASGYCPAVERYLKEEMNDPDSLEMGDCTKAKLTGNGWIVGCEYRGRNAFGGLVKQANWFAIQRGVVTHVYPDGRG